MQLIISEKPSTAKIIASAVGAAEKEYDGKEFCYKGNGCYVVNARGHLYSLGMPENYGFSKAYKMDELPMFPEFDLFPESESTEGLRRIIGKLINLPEVESIICATDAGREGELIFRHIYNANKCTKPVYRLWCNSMTDEAIKKCMENLPPDSSFDGEYNAALARKKSDWIIGMNLSRLYGIMDNYPHRVGRVKTPVLSIIAQRDKEIENFSKTVSYRLETDNGAVSEQVYSSKEEAEKVLAESRGTDANVQSAVTENKSKNRPLLHSLTTLQQEANRVYGYTAKEVLEAAQSLYEKKFTTYPRTDCNYVSEDMKGKVIAVVSKLIEREEYSERSRQLLGQALNFDSRVVNNKAMEGHDHHAIIPEENSDSLERLTGREQNVYHLVVNRLLCALDKPYTYTETSYELWCNDVTYKLKTVKPLELGWKKYDTEADETESYELSYTEGSTFIPADIHIKICETQPPKHYTDASLLSVMNNIDNRIEDESLKSAVKGKGIGTEATRADVIEQLINVGYVERDKKNIIATPLGRAFIDSLPDSLKSLERTAEWEQTFNNIKENGLDSESFIEEIKAFVTSVIRFEQSPSRHRMPLDFANPNAKQREVLGTCPRCGRNIYEGEKNYFCESGRDGCGYTVWKNDKFIEDSITAEHMKNLLSGKSVKLRAKSKEPKILH
jgi:DNA topoisomerase-3